MAAPRAGIAFEAIVERLLRAQHASADGTVRDVLARVAGDRDGYELPIDRVIVHAGACDRLGFAFAVGYSGATRALGARLGVVTDGHLGLAATEAGGAHPRAIATRLDERSEGAVLDGQKAWCTLAFEAERLVVIANSGELSGRPVLKAVVVPCDRSGVRLTAMPDTPFCPEVKHAYVTLDHVRIEPGEIAAIDAYADLLKPFRTVEDIHVQAALLAWLVALGARSGFDRQLLGRATLLLGAVRGLSVRDDRHATTHIALAAAIDGAASLVRELEPSFARSSGDVFERFVRDQPLLAIAAKVRAARTERAWARIASLPESEA